MTLEEKLKAKEVIYVPNCILIEDALEIIREYEKQVRIDENKHLLDKCVGIDGWCVTDVKIVDRIKELEKL